MVDDIESHWDIKDVYTTFFFYRQKFIPFHTQAWIQTEKSPENVFIQNPPKLLCNQLLNNLS